MAHDQLTIGETARRAGIAPSALRFYEAHGLLEATRTAGNQRRYPRSTLRRIAFIRSAQRVGLRLEEIRESLETLPAGRTPTTADWSRLAETWKPRVDAEIRRLQALRDSLDQCIGCGCLSLEKCALSNPSDRLGDSASGPVLLDETTQ
ncbi:redox-sensitive transcriptional activator SoxR [Mariniluteicoccus flavus]